VIVGLGVDLVDVERLRKALDRWGERLLTRVFTTEEIESARARADFAVSLAARFAAKEAAYKTIRERFPDGLALRSIVVSTEPDRPPRISLTGRVPRELRDLRWWCSLTHTDGLACAVVVAEHPAES
jgi:holo-[acyl-carrier protein] synthase